MESIGDPPARTAVRRRWRPARITAVAAALLGLGLAGVAALGGEGSHAGGDGADPAAVSVTTRSPLLGALVVSARSVRVARGATSTSFGIANTGDLPVIYQVSTRTPWIRARSIGGSLGGGSGQRVDLLLDQSAGGREGATGTVVVSWNGGPDVVLRVHLDGEPLVSRPGSTRSRSARGSR